MTPAQQEHVDFLVKYAEGLTRRKYARGALEHGGNIWDQTTFELVMNAIDENIDQFVYLVTAAQKLSTGGLDGKSGASVSGRPEGDSVRGEVQPAVARVRRRQRQGSSDHSVRNAKNPKKRDGHHR